MTGSAPESKGPAPSGSDRRADRRKHHTCAAKLVSKTGAAFNCTILDISKGGARICCGTTPPHNEPIFLLDLVGRMVHRAVIVSKLGKEFGLRFVSSHQLGCFLPVEMQFLKRMWFESVQ